MGLSFYDKPSLVEAAESVLRFAPDDPNPISQMGSINQDGDIGIAPEHLDPAPDMGSIDRERGDDDEVGRGADIQIVNRRKHGVERQPHISATRSP
jgi:hypothetical protein